MFLDHYGLEADTNGIYIFIATVPVTLDCFFKLWVSGASPLCQARRDTLHHRILHYYHSMRYGMLY